MLDDPTVAALAARCWSKWEKAIRSRDDIALGALQRLQGEIDSGIISKHHDWEQTADEHTFGAHALRPTNEPTVTDREREVLQLIADGNTYPEVAAELGIGLETIRQYTRNLRAKLGAKNITRAVVIAMERGEIE